MAKSKKHSKPAAAKAKAHSQNSPMMNDAAAAAASMVWNLSSTPSNAGSSPPKKESASFKQMKASLTPAPSQTVGNILDQAQAAGQKKSAVPFANKQVGHNQVFGADVNRMNIPRRTGG